MDGYSQENHLPEGLEVKGALGEGYEVLAAYQSWKVAVITYAQRFDRRNLRRLERHRATDEVFILAKGEAVLLIGREGQAVEMEPCKAYRVKCRTWHGICVSPDAVVIICEEADTGPDNTDYTEHDFKTARKGTQKDETDGKQRDL